MSGRIDVQYQKNQEDIDNKIFSEKLDPKDFDALKHYVKELDDSNPGASISYVVENTDNQGGEGFSDPKYLSFSNLVAGLSASDLPSLRFPSYLTHENLAAVQKFDKILTAIEDGGIYAIDDADDKTKLDIALGTTDGSLNQEDIDAWKALYDNESAKAKELYNNEIDNLIDSFGTMIDNAQDKIKEENNNQQQPSTTEPETGTTGTKEGTETQPEGTSTEIPVTDKKTEAPVTDKKTEAPVTTGTTEGTETQPEGTSTEIPVTDKKTEAPVTDKKTEAPVTTGTTEGTETQPEGTGTSETGSQIQGSAQDGAPTIYHETFDGYQVALDKKFEKKTNIYNQKNKKAAKQYFNTKDNSLMRDEESVDDLQMIGTDYEAIFGKEGVRNNEESMIKMLKNITKKGEINAISAIKALDTYANVYTPKITDNHPDVTSFVDDFLSHGLASYEPMAGAGKKISKKEHKNLEKFAQAYIYGSLSKQVKGENGKRVNTREFYASDDYRTVVVDGYFNMLRMGKNNMSQIARNIKTSNNMEEIEDTDTPSEEEKKRLSTTYEDVMNMTPEEVESLINTDLSYQLAGLFGDINSDGRLVKTNIGLQGKQQEKYNKKNQIDVNTISGSSIAQAFIDVKRDAVFFHKKSPAESEQKLVKGLIGILKGSLSGDPQMKKWLDEHMKTLDDKETEQDLWNLLKEKPHFKLYYKDFFGKYGEEIHTILDKGPAYAQWIAERWKHDKEAQNTEEAEAAGIDNTTAVGDKNIDEFEDNLSFKESNSIDKFLSEEWAKTLKTIAQDIEEAKKEGTYSEDDIAQLEKSYKSLQEKKNTKHNIKVLRRKLLGLGAGIINGNAGGGMAMNFSLSLKELSEKKGGKGFANVLSKAFDSFNITPGVLGYKKAEGGMGAMIGMAVSLTARKELNNKGLYMMYGVGGGVGVNTEGKIMAGPSMYLGLEKNINHQSLRKSLGNEAAHYIGGVVHTSIFATTLSAHWSKDKLESMEAKKDAIYEGFKKIVGSALGKGMKTTEADIITALKAQYPKTPGDKISSFASDLHQMLVHFDATAWKDENDKDKDLFTEQEKSNAFGRIQEIIADHFAQQFWNENVEKIAKGWFEFSGVSIGVTLLAHSLPIPSIGIRFTDYKQPTYSESKASAERAYEHVLGKGWGAESIDLTPAEFTKGLNMRFHLGDGFVFQEGEPDTIAISEDVLQTLNLHIVPELKQFVAYQDGKLIIPASMMMTLTRISHAENVDYHLIIGHQGVKRYLDKDHYEDKVDDPKTTKNESKSDSDGADIEVIKSFDEFTNHKGDPAEFEKYAVQWTARKIDQRTLDQKVQDLPSVKSLQLTDNDTKLTITTLGENPPGQTITIDVPTDGLIGKKLLITVKTDGSQEVKLEPGVDGATTFEVEYRKIGSHTGEVITDLDTDIANVSNSINQFIVPEKIAEFHYLPDTNDIKKAFDVAAVKGDWGSLKENKAVMDVARSILGKTATDADISDAEFYTLYAQESRVYSTMYKQLEGKEKGQTSLDAMKAKAQELLKKCAITNTNKKDALSTFINGWNGTGENPTLIQEALGVDITKRNHWLGYGPKGKNTPEYKLAFLLAPIYQIIEHRHNPYNKDKYKFSASLISKLQKARENMIVGVKDCGAICETDSIKGISAVASYKTSPDKITTNTTIVKDTETLISDLEAGDEDRLIGFFESMVQDQKIMKAYVDAMESQGVNLGDGDVNTKWNMILTYLKSGEKPPTNTAGRYAILSPAFFMAACAHCLNDQLTMKIKIKFVDKDNKEIVTDDVVQKTSMSSTVTNAGQYKINDYNIMLNAETRKQEIAFAYAQNIEKGSQNSKGTNGTGNSNAGSNSNQDNGNSNTGGYPKQDTNGTGNGPGS